MISIVMTYFNRLPLLRHTLSTIDCSTCRDVEIIIVDDFSAPEHNLDTIKDEFPTLLISVIRMQDEVPTKDYCNPCVPFNVGFRYAKGDIIVLQNPECCHVGDVLEHIANTLTDENYLVFHCFASTVNQLDELHRTNNISIPEDTKFGPAGGCWYVHEEHRPLAWHFTSAITTNNLKALNGFDERLAYGRGGDDVEFLYRINHLGLKVEFVRQPFVVHQWHPKDISTSYDVRISTHTNAEISYQTKISGMIRAPNQRDI